MAYKFKHYSSAMHKNKTVELSMASGDQVINADDGTVMTKTTVTKPTTLVAENIKKDVSIGGVTGTLEGKKIEQEKTVELSMASGDQEITSDDGKVLTKVVVTKPETLLPENIKKDITIGGIVGTHEGGGSSVNIAYGQNAPSDTSKMWIQASAPDEISFNKVIEKPFGYASYMKLPEPMTDVFPATVGNKVYLFGGYNGSARLDAIRVYDSVSGAVETLSVTLPSAMNNVLTAVIGTKIYLIGGYGSSYSNAVYVFDTTDNSITTLSVTISDVTSVTCAAAVGNKIYIFSNGSTTYKVNVQILDTSNNTLSAITVSYKFNKLTSRSVTAVVGTKIYLFGGYYSYINVYDTIGDTMATINTTLPIGYSGIRAVSVGDKVYLFGGLNRNSSLTVNYDRILKFDTTDNSITTLDAVMLVGANSIGAALVDSKIYLFGGYADFYNNSYYSVTLDMISCFDTVKEEIIQLDQPKLKEPVYSTAAIALDGKIYIFGGSNVSSNYIKTIQIYDTATKLTTKIDSVIPDTGRKDGASLAVIGTKIYIFSVGNGKDIFAFDTKDNSIVEINAESPTMNVSGAAVGTTLYLFSGSTIYAVNTISDTITKLDATLPVSIGDKSAASVGSKIYLFGYNAIMVFDSSDNTIVTLDITMPVAAYDVKAVAVGTKIYLIIYDNESIYEFDTVNNTLTNLGVALPDSTLDIEVATDGTTFYIIGGRADGDSYRRGQYDISEIREIFTLTNGNISVLEGDTEYTFDILKSPTKVEMSVQNVYKGNSLNESEFVDAYIHDGTDWKNINTGELIGLITTHLTKISASSDNPNRAKTNESVTLYFTADSGYDLPDNVTVTGATSTWAKSTGALTLSNPTGNVSISIAGVAIARAIALNLSNVTGSSSNAATIKTDTSVTLYFTADSGYDLPDNVTVTGATSTWAKSTGALTLSNPTGDVSISIAGVMWPKISAPTISVVSGAANPTIQIDTIANDANAIEIFADGVSIGSVTKE